MENVKVRRSAFYTRNLGNFENAKVGYEIEATVSDGETAELVRARLVDKIDGWIKEDIRIIDEESGHRRG